jgi:tRNA pseudouridine55 synthase
MASSPPSIEGILLIDKPQGITSHDVVDRVRRTIKLKKVGHAGTLDPMATGLLLILVGKATKLSQYLMGLDKTYEGTILLGQSTDSHDAEGIITEDTPVPPLSEEEVSDFIKSYLGDQYQIPPMFSAKKIDGKPLYKLARKGMTVEREPRFIRVNSFQMLRWESPEIDFTISCSKGTYVRTLANDLGQKIGCGAHLIKLSRTAIEKFHLHEATQLANFEVMSLEEIQRKLIPSYQAVPSQIL